MDAVRGALGRRDHLPRLLANHVGMLDDAPVSARSLGRLQLDQGAVMGSIALVAEENDVAFCTTVSGGVGESLQRSCLGTRGASSKYL